MRRAMHDAGARREAGLFEREQELVRLGARIDNVVFGAPSQVNGSLVVALGGVADRRCLEIDAAILRWRNPQQGFDQVVARIADLGMTPLCQQIVDAVDPDKDLYPGADFGVSVVRITTREEWIVARKRDQGGKMRACRVAPQGDPLGI